MLKNANKIAVPKRVLEGITAVRNSGLTNMFDVVVVVKIMEVIGLTEASAWIQSNREAYIEGIFKGFKEE